LRPSNLRDDRGAASVLAVGMIATVMVVTLAMAQLGTAVVARHRAQAAADLAALAAAGGLAGGQAGACAAADVVLTAMRARSAGCSVEGLDVVVTVTVPVRLGRWGIGQAQASARAGPG
jgi:secretion/DNA translocation related TadE-like protein